MIKIDYQCFLNQSGYSVAAQNMILSLYYSNKYDIKISQFTGTSIKNFISDEKHLIFNQMREKKDDKDSVQIIHCIPNLQKNVKKRKKKNIGFATFETFDPPQKWIDILNENDAIITPSMFNYKIFSHARIKKPIFYIPHCLNFNDLDNIFCEKRESFTFLFIGTWKERKGYKQLIEAWLKEFNNKDNVSLLIKTDKVSQARTYVEKIKKEIGITRGFAPIIFEDKILNEKEMTTFIKSCNCMVLPSMGEGFCSLPGANVVTIDGFKSIEDIKKGEEVYTHTGTFRRVSTTMSRFYSGQIIKMDILKGFESQKLTPNHSILVVRRSDCLCDKRKDGRIDKTKINIKNSNWVQCGQVSEGDFLLYPIEKKINSRVMEKIDFSKYATHKNIKIENNFFDFKRSNGLGNKFKTTFDVDVDLLWLFGIYVAEGCSYKSGIAFSFHKKENEYYNRVMRIMKDKFGLNSRLVLKENKAIVVISSVILANIFSNLLGSNSHIKSINKLGKLNIDDFLVIFRAILDGDGHYDDSNKVINLETVSENLMKNLFYDLLKYGISADLKITKRKTYRLKIYGEDISVIKWKDISWTGMYYRSKMHKDENFHYLPITKIEKIDYNGIVYNLEVEEDNSYVLQSIVHNCISGLQALGLKIPLIVTNFSGSKDYANDKTSTLIEPRGFVLRKEMDNIPQFRDKKWAFISVEDVRKSMRYVLNNPVKIKEKTEYAREYIEDKFSYKRIEVMFSDMLRILYGI